MIKIILSQSQLMRAAIAKLTAGDVRMVRGHQPVSGVQTLVGKAEKLPRGHVFRSTVAALLVRRRSLQ